MNKRVFFGLIALGIFGLCFWANTNRPKDSVETLLAAKISGSGIAARQAASTPLEATESAQSNTTTAPAHDSRVFSKLERDAFFESSEVLEQRQTPPDAEGLYVRKKLLRTTGKYPLIRVEETWLKDPATGNETRLSQLAMVADHFVTEPLVNGDRGKISDFVRQKGGQIRRQLPNSQVFLIQIPSAALEDFEIMAKSLMDGDSPFNFVEPDYLVFPSVTVNDPSLDELWGLHNTGQTGGSGDADIDGLEAWDFTMGSSSIVVGVIDTGVDYTHPDLAANIWTNTLEIPDNGIDDDLNGYVDDVRGWDFVNNDKDPMDDHKHGTHCAGTIGAVANNGIGIAGVCPVVRIMPLKFLAPQTGGATSDAMEAINYATKNRATLTSNSWGGGGYSNSLRNAISAARLKGILFVAAAGNDSNNNDNNPSYPASYAETNIISVAATDHNDRLASFSNYGERSVDIAAPGVAIYSTVPGGGYANLNGTSMACPHVAGAVALLIAAKPSLAAEEVRGSLLSNVDTITSLKGKVTKGGRLNVARALMLGSVPHVSVFSLTSFDNGEYGSVGNSDKILNPGENISLILNLKNFGLKPSLGTRTSLSLVAGTGIVLFDAEHTWGTIEPDTIVNNNSSSFRFRIPLETQTPMKFTLRFTTTDSEGHSWTSDSSFSALKNSTVTGRVLNALNSSPLTGSYVNYTKSGVKKFVVPQADGTFSLSLTDGTYTFEAFAPGFSSSEPLTVTVPPSTNLPPFFLGRAKLGVTPTSLTSTQLEGEIKQHTLVLSNSGNKPLTVTLSASGNSASALSVSSLSESPLESLGPDGRSGGPRAAEVDIMANTLSDLPFEDGFEGGTLEGWTVDGGSGLKEVVNGLSATGVRSLHVSNAADNAHYSGVHRDFVTGSKPKQVSFWVRASSVSSSTANVVLANNGVDLVNFHISEGGVFQVNSSQGGPQAAVCQPGTWYRIEFRDLDWQAKHFDFYVNGSLVQADVALRNPAKATQITQAYFYCFTQETEAWWDDISLTASNLPWLTHAPATVTLAPGQNAQVNVTVSGVGLVAGTYSGAINFVSNDPVTPQMSVPVTLNLQAPPNTAPVATAQTLSLNEDSQIVVTLSGTDAENDPMTALITQLPTLGTLWQTSDGLKPTTAITSVPALVTNNARKVIYQPAPNGNGNAYATLKFALQDKRAQSAAVTVTFNVSPVNDLPVANHDTASSLPGQTITNIQVLANDSDADSDALTVSSFTQGAKGVVSQSSGVFSYAPAVSFTQGQDVFTYTVSDGRGGSSTASVMIVIGQLAGGNWNGFGNGGRHTGYYPASLGGLTFLPNWTLTLGRTLNHPTIAEGKVFVSPISGAPDAHVTAINTATGTISWRKDFPSAYNISGVSYYKSNLYLQRGNGNSDSQLWSLRAESGATVWSAPFKTQAVQYLPPAVSEGTVYMSGGQDGGCYAFNRTSGAQVFFRSLSPLTFVAWTPTLDAVDSPFVYVNASVSKLNKTSGLDVGKVTLPYDSSQYSGPAGTACFDAVTNSIMVAGPNGLFSINVAGSTPVVRWRVTGDFHGIPAVANGKVYGMSYENRSIKEFVASTGAFLGEYSTGAFHSLSQPIITNDSLITSVTSTTFVFKLSDRTLQQQIPYGGRLALSNGQLVLAGTDGMLRCYTVNSGNNLPVAAPLAANCVEDENVTLTLNGTDSDGDLLSVMVSSLPTKGTLYQTSDGIQLGAPIVLVPALVTNPGGKVIFRPAADDFGISYSSFSYKVNDGVYSSAGSLVTIDVTGVNDAPIAYDDLLQLRSGEGLSSYFPTANDFDADKNALPIVSFTLPSKGTLSQNTDGSLRYQPFADFTEGTDSFTYTLNDALGLSATARVELKVGASYGKEWGNFRNTTEHTGHYPGSLGLTPLVQLWSFPVASSTHPLVVGEDRVFMNETSEVEGYLHSIAVDAKSGGQVWRTRHESGMSTIKLNPPSYHRGAVYMQHTNSVNSTLRSLNASDGSIQWKAPFSAQHETYLAPTVSDLGIFVGGGTYGGIYGYNPSSGSQLFFQSLDQYQQWTPVLANGMLFSYMNGKFREHNLATGAVLSTTTFEMTPSSTGGVPCIVDGRAFLYSQTNVSKDIVCLDLSSKLQVWRIPYVNSTGVGVSSFPSVANGMVYVIVGNSVKAHQATTGKLFTTYEASAQLLGTVFVAHDILVVSSFTETFLFNLANQTLIQKLPFASTAAAAKGVLYLNCSDKNVRAYGRVSSTNRAPEAEPLVLTVEEESQIGLQLQGTDADGDSLSYLIQSLPPSGTLYQTVDGSTKGAAITQVPVLLNGGEGRVIYLGARDTFGPNIGSFTYSVHDGQSSSPIAAVEITVTNVNDAPVAVDDTVALRPAQTLYGFYPQINDRDADADNLSIRSFTQGGKGVVSQSSDGSLQYVPDIGFTSGNDTFSYVVTDPAGTEDTGTVTIVVSTTYGREWHTFGGSPDHPGYLPISLGSAQFASKWTTTFVTPSNQPVIAGGRVFLTSLVSHDTGGCPVALDAISGGLVWGYRTSPNASPFAPTHYDGRIYFQSGGKFFCLNGVNGALVWSAPYSFQSEKHFPPAVDVSGAYIATGNTGSSGGLQAHNLSNGNSLFFSGTLEPYDMWSPTLHGDGLYSFVSGHFRKHNKATGAVEWDRNLTWQWPGHYSMNRTVACAGNRAYLVNESVTVPSGDQEVFAFELPSGVESWRVKGKFYGTPAVAHNTVYVISEVDSITNKIRSFDSATGAELGTYSAPSSETALHWQPILTNDTLIVFSLTNTYIFDLKTRALRQTIPFGGLVSLAGETLYIAGQSDKVVRAYAVPDPLNKPPVATPLVIATEEDTPVPVSLAATDADSDSVSFVISRLPVSGKLYQTTDGVTMGNPINSAPSAVTGLSAKVIYLPFKDLNGANLDGFGYAATDGKSFSPEAGVSLSVTAVNDAPFPFADFRQIEPGQILSPIREMLNDLDVDGDELTLVSFTQPSKGRVMANDDGTLRYESPRDTTSGSYSFSYTVRDPAGLTSTATVSLSIVPTVQGLWTTFGNGPEHTGKTSASLGRTAWGLRWKRTFAETGLNQAVVAEGKVFVSVAGYHKKGLVTALSEKTGQTVWSREFPASFSLNPPSYFEGRIYVQRVNHDTDSQLFALNASNGSTVWSSPFEAQWANHLAPAVSNLGIFVNAGFFGGLYAFEPTTGARRFVASMPQVDLWTPAILGNELYSFVNGVVTRHNPTDGKNLWTKNLGSSAGGGMNRSLTLVGRRALFVNNSPAPDYGKRDVVCLDLDSRNVVWSIRGDFTGTPTVANDIVYTLGLNTVEARALIDGRLLMTCNVPVGEYLANQPIVTDDLLIVQSDKRTYLFGLNDGELVQTFDQGGYMAVADDQLIISDRAGVLYAYAARPAVTFSPDGGTFAEPVAVTMNAAESGGRIHYTLDGSAPSLESPSFVAGNPVLVEATGRIRAIFVKGSAISRINEATFTMLDSDGDGVPDWWENARFGGLALANLNSDSDGDGSPDRDEFIAGTNPFDANDFFHLSEARLNPANPESLTLSWPSTVGNLYLVEKSTDMVSWTLAFPPLQGTGTSLSFSPSTTGQTRTFYRVKATPALEEVSP